jgi:hypothetical protein
VLRREATDRQVVRATQAFTVFWGIVAVAFASFASLLDNLIQAVNILGSLFYGTVLGLFLTAFFLVRVRGRAVFIAALCSQATVLALFATSQIGYLWFNLIGCALVVSLSLAIELLSPRS